MLPSLELRRRYFKDSGYLTVSNSTTITAGNKFNFALDERFKPYNDILITNLNSSNDCIITVNYNTIIPLPKGTDVKPQIPVRTIEIKNNGSSTISANEIQINYRNDGYRGKEVLNNASTWATVGTFVRSLWSR